MCLEKLQQISRVNGTLPRHKASSIQLDTVKTVSRRQWVDESSPSSSSHETIDVSFTIPNAFDSRIQQSRIMSPDDEQWSFSQTFAALSYLQHIADYLFHAPFFPFNSIVAHLLPFSFLIFLLRSAIPSYFPRF